MVEDVVTTGASTLKAIERVEARRGSASRASSRWWTGWRAAARRSPRGLRAHHPLHPKGLPAVRFAALLLLVGAGGCAAVPPTIGEPGPELSDARAEQSYRAALARVTEHREVYSGLDTRLYAPPPTRAPSSARRAPAARRCSRPGPRPSWTMRSPGSGPTRAGPRGGVRGARRRLPLRRLRSKYTIWRASLATDQGRGLSARSQAGGARQPGHARLLPVPGRLLDHVHGALPPHTRLLAAWAAAGGVQHEGAALPHALHAGAGGDGVPGRRARGAVSPASHGARAPALSAGGAVTGEPARPQYTRRSSTPQPAPARKKAHSVFVPSGMRPAPCRPRGAGAPRRAPAARAPRRRRRTPCRRSRPRARWTRCCRRPAGRCAAPPPAHRPRPAAGAAAQ